jgi:hypothetical protein
LEDARRPVPRHLRSRHCRITITLSDLVLDFAEQVDFVLNSVGQDHLHRSSSDLPPSEELKGRGQNRAFLIVMELGAANA